jgi:hypothetical protein
LNAYALAFGILGAVLFVVGLVPILPVVRRRQQILSFRQALANVDVVVLTWEASLQDGPPPDDMPDPIPDFRRSRRERREQEGGWDPWV